MTQKITLCLVVCAILALSVAAFAEENLDKYLTPDNIAKLEKGETILFDQTYTDDAGKTRGKGLAVIMVNATPENVWKYLPDFNNYKDFMPRMTSSKIYSDASGKVGVAYTIKVAFKEVNYNCMHTFDKANGYIRYKLDDSKKNDIVSTEGYWKIIPHGDKTIIAYTVAVDTGIAIPKMIQDYLTKKDLPNVVQAAKKRIESGGTYKKS